MHSATGVLGLTFDNWVRTAVLSTEIGILKPLEPVSTAMLGMVWQFEVDPGAQTVTVVNATFT
jgi:hypothetical protein